jgi:hypothetical protein
MYWVYSRVLHNIRLLILCLVSSALLLYAYLISPNKLALICIRATSSRMNSCSMTTFVITCNKLASRISSCSSSSSPTGFVSSTSSFGGGWYFDSKTSTACEPAGLRKRIRRLWNSEFLSPAKFASMSENRVVCRFAAWGAGSGDSPLDGEPTRVCPPNLEGAGDIAGAFRCSAKASFLPRGDCVLDGVVGLSSMCFGICGVQDPGVSDGCRVGFCCGVDIFIASCISS